MNLKKTLLAGMAAACLMTSQAAVAQTPPPGDPSTAPATWATMPVGAHIMIAGFIFVVTVSGLVLLDDDENEPSEGTTTTTTPSTSTTTT